MTFGFELAYGIMTRNIITVLAVSVLLFSTDANGANKIDSLKTDLDVELFIRSLHPGYKEFKLASPADLCMSECFRTETIKYRDTADFDGNHRTDLVVVGLRGPDDPINIVVVDTGNGFNVVSIGLDYQYYGSCFITVDSKNRSLLRKHIEIYEGWQPCGFIRHELLHYQFGGFIEYTQNHNSKPISKIALSTTFCYGRCPVFDMSVDQNGEVLYIAKSDNPDTGAFKTQIHQSVFNDLAGLISYINVDSMESKYDIGITDQATYFLTVTYADGSSRKIEDYGAHGTAGLRLIYAKFYTIRRNVNWQECK
jgi:hypothetical protein